MLIYNENASSETIVLYNPAIPPVLHSRGMGEGVRFICESEVRKPFQGLLISSFGDVFGVRNFLAFFFFLLFVIARNHSFGQFPYDQLRIIS